jgi:peptidylprolyl isomerase
MNQQILDHRRPMHGLYFLLLAAIFGALWPAVLPAHDAAEAQTSPAPSPGEIVAAADPSEWVDIAPSDLMVMELHPDAAGKPRTVVIQLIPAPFSQGWIGNIRTLVAARWYDGNSINRVQDNYVVQWGDATGTKALPPGLKAMQESDYFAVNHGCTALSWLKDTPPCAIFRAAGKLFGPESKTDSYGGIPFIYAGWPLTLEFFLGEDMLLPGRDEPKPGLVTRISPTHCYGMVGVGRELSPDTGSGAELYTVIGHAPRHLDRNIALVGRVIAGIEHLSALPRGTGPLGVYTDAAQHVPIRSVRMSNELPPDEQPKFQYLSTESKTFAHYAEARANRRDPFFIRPAGGADICNIPVPIRKVAE